MTMRERVKRFGHGMARLGRRLGQLQASLILSLFYFVLLAPVAIVFKFLADPLRLRKSERSLWCTRVRPNAVVEWGKRQF